MDIDNRNDRNRRLSGASCERIILYVDDFAAATGQDLSLGFYKCDKDIYALMPGEPDGARMSRRSSLYPPALDSLGLQLDDRSGLYLLDAGDRSPSPNLCSQTSTPRRSRCNLDVDQRSSRRSSMQSSRSRTNSCGRPTPLGDDRRASVSRKSRPRRASTATLPRKDSVRPMKTDVRQTPKTLEDAQQLEQARRHRRIAMIVLGTFIFLLAASVLVVVITLTQSSHLSPASILREQTERNLRKENEELYNSLNRDISVPENVTAPP
ncbi:PREDICTED: uncharacterized protein LOC105565290 [Vollenhovia emeryi]|uniref:uncharacterized protein LOC105565290 n=1 Tax=Vollenhovia emeryi TaxID=411798 RepID=UPI0005F3AB71|nr:PREDICTED: uncharacterized protein LOC105565290 [Vollenhovia emeryi]